MSRLILKSEAYEASASALPAARLMPLVFDWLDLQIQKTIRKRYQHTLAGTGPRPGPHTLRFLKSAQTLGPSPPGTVVWVVRPMTNSQWQ
jgi:hypothetical protein